MDIFDKNYGVATIFRRLNVLCPFFYGFAMTLGAQAIYMLHFGFVEGNNTTILLGNREYEVFVLRLNDSVLVKSMFEAFNITFFTSIIIVFCRVVSALLENTEISRINEAVKSRMKKSTYAVHNNAVLFVGSLIFPAIYVLFINFDWQFQDKNLQHIFQASPKAYLFMQITILTSIHFLLSELLLYGMSLRLMRQIS